MTTSQREKLKRMMNRMKLGTYGAATNAQRRLQELQGAFEDMPEWIFEREGVNREQIIWVYPPMNMTSHEDISAFIRKKSIAYRQEQRELQASKEEENA